MQLDCEDKTIILQNNNFSSVDSIITRRFGKTLYNKSKIFFFKFNIYFKNKYIKTLNKNNCFYTK